MAKTPQEAIQGALDAGIEDAAAFIDYLRDECAMEVKPKESSKPEPEKKAPEPKDEGEPSFTGLREKGAKMIENLRFGKAGE
jgi:hypothetical protein